MKSFSVLLLSVLLSILSNVFTAPIAANKQCGLISSSSSTDSVVQDYIYFSTGHHGYIWAKICRDSSGFRLYNGMTRYWMEESPSEPFDTVRLIHDNIETIKWGMDSLWQQAKRLKPMSPETYSTFYSQMFVVHGNDTLFTLDNAMSFVGENDEIFNANLQRLKFLMYWLASPTLHEYLPVPHDTLPSKTSLK